jgi:transglutaminase-like putative cysteine protease
MVYRISWLAGIAGIGFALARAERLLRASSAGVPWQVLLVAAAILGGTLTWGGIAYRLGGGWLSLMNGMAMAITVVRIAVPASTWLIFPTAGSLPALATEMAFTRDVIRTGAAPVAPLPGIIAILAAVFWAMGALLVWGLLTARPYVAVLTPLVVYLEFAVMDRSPSGVWTTVFLVALGLTLLAVALDRRRDGTGVLVSPTTRLALVRSIPSAGVVLLVVVLVIASGVGAALATLVPRNGYLDWRSHSGLSGQYYGSIAYNPFVGIRQGLLSQTNTPVFVADVTGDIPGDQLYWRLVTLDVYDGSQWHVAEDPRVVGIDDAGAYERPDMAFSGPTTTVTAKVTVLALQMDWLPAPYAPVSLFAEEDAVQHGVTIRFDDGSLRFDALTYRGMTYTVDSRVPQPDISVLSLGADGAPSIVFGGAIADGEFSVDEPSSPPARRDLPDRDHFLELPADLDAGIRSLARQQTTGLQTDFERGLALESYFRTSGGFRYSTAVVPGHGATDLAAWLLDPGSDNYRTGYCEQFATSMAVMARALGIPSRVVLGFAPGTDYDQEIVVRDRDAHAWVELWMPTQGWVRFDPTPRGDNSSTSAELPFPVAAYLEDVPTVTIPDQPVPTGVTTRPDSTVTVPTGGPGPGAGDGGAGVPPGLVWAILGGAVLAAALPVVKTLRRRRRLARLDVGDVAAGWQEIVDRLADLGDGPAPWATPAEIAGGVDPAMSPLAEVYGESVYGGVATLAPERVAAARTAFADTEAALRSRYSAGMRALARYRLTSLRPRRPTPRG